MNTGIARVLIYKKFRQTNTLPKINKRKNKMKDLLEICCGLDVHKDMVVACLLKGEVNKEPIIEIREFSTLLTGLSDLQKWLYEENCFYIAMESTGVYWYMVYNVLEAGFEGLGAQITVTNPRHMKNVPGKKTDIKDAQWIAILLRAGLLKPSYVPPRDIRELRDLTRYRKNMVHETSTQKNRIEKYLQQCGFKLSTFLSDIFGVSGMSIIRHLCEKGEILPDEVLELLYGTARRKVSDIRAAVNGKMTLHQQKFLKMLVDWYEQCKSHVEDVERRMLKCAERYREAIDLICTIPSMQQISAITIIAETGVDLRMFPSSGHFCSWTGMCPADNESAGKRKSAHLSKGNRYIKTILCQCAWGTTRNRKSYLHDWYWKLKQRKDGKRAVIALGHKLLTFIYHILNTKNPFDEERHIKVKMEREQIRKRRIIAEAKKLGLTVTD